MRKFASIVLLITAPSLAQVTPQPGALEVSPSVQASNSATASDAAPGATGLEGQPASASSTVEHGLSSSDLAAARLLLAADADMTGDAASSTARRQEVLDASLRRLSQLPPDSEEYFRLARHAINAAYFLGWSHLDNQDIAAATRIMSSIDSVLSRYSRVPLPPPPLVLPAARFEWLKQRFYADRQEPLMQDAARRRAFELTQNPDIYLGDYLALMSMRINILWYTRGEARESARDEACRLAEQLHQLFPNEIHVRMSECAMEEAWAALRSNDRQRLEQSLARARQFLTARLQDEPNDVRVQLSVVDLQLSTAEIYDQIQDARQANSHRFAAFEGFVNALRGRSYFQNSPFEVSSLYSRFSNISLEDHPRYPTEDARRMGLVDIYRRVSESVQESLRAFPRSPSYLVVAGDSLARLALNLVEIGQLGEARAVAEQSVDLYRRNSPIAAATSFYEEPESECRAYGNRVRVYLGARNGDGALQAYRDLVRVCGSWFRRYPWDFYARQHLEGSAMRLGRLLHQEHRYTDALPILQFSSDWGARDSTLYLVDMYRHGRGVPADPERADQLARFAASQSMKRFTVPTDFAGVRHPFHVYVMEYARGEYCPIRTEPLPENSTCIGFEGIDDQVEWVRQARGGEVPQDVVTSFRRLNQIARENDVSFPDLAVYALGAARQEQTAAAGQSERPADAGEQGDASDSGASGGSETPSRAATTEVSAPPATTAGPEPQLTTWGGRFFAEDISGAQPVQTETFVIPFRPGTSCFRWSIAVDPVDRPVTITEIFDLPAAPRTWGDDPSRHQVSENGRRATTTRVQSTEDRALTTRWCIEEGDPTGIHRFRILHGARLLYDVEFEILPPS